MDEDRTGQVVAGQYHVERQLGRGAFGVVWLCRRMDSGQPLVLKVLHAQWAKVPTVLERFRREAQVANRINHPNVAAVYDYGATDEGVPFMALEYLPGHTLKEELKRSGAMPLPRASEIWAPVCDAVAAAHVAGIVHRDLKPENVMLTNRGQGLVPVVLDFGIAKVLDAAEKLTSTGSMLGTPTYMAPEQCRGQTDLGPPADVYSLGAICFELLAGRPPFVGKTVAELAMKHLLDQPPPLVQAPPPLSSLVARCLAKEPAQRPAAGELAEALRQAARQPFHGAPSNAADITIPEGQRPSLAEMDRARAQQIGRARSPTPAAIPIGGNAGALTIRGSNPNAANQASPDRRSGPGGYVPPTSVAQTIMVADSQQILGRHAAPRRGPVRRPQAGPPLAALIVAVSALIAAVLGLLAALLLR